jgi:hypothetical protein
MTGMALHRSRGVREMCDVRKSRVHVHALVWLRDVYVLNAVVS